MPESEPKHEPEVWLGIVGGQYVTEQRNGRVSERKYVSPAAVRKAFAGLTVDSGWLAPGVVRWGEAPRGEWAVLHVGPARAKLWVLADGKKNSDFRQLTVTLPGFALLGVGRDYYVWAVKSPVLVPGTEMYHAPLPNVHPDGLICWGTNAPPRASGGQDILRAWSLFIASPFNADLASSKSKKHAKDVRVMLREVSRAPARAAYPVRDLVGMGRYASRTLDRAVSEQTEKAGR